MAAVANHTNCFHNALPEAWPGKPKDRSYWAIPNWNESFVGMTECCTPNQVHISGEDNFEVCVLWCLIPNSILKDKDGEKGDKDAVLAEMKNCVRNKGGLDWNFINTGDMKDNAAASSKMGRTTLLGVGVWALMAVGLLA